MSKSKASIIGLDFDIGCNGVVPCTQIDYKNVDGVKEVKKSPQASLDFVKFLKEIIKKEKEKHANLNIQFPTEGGVFILFIQYFNSKEEFFKKDIDNMSKTVLDALKGELYKDDYQVFELYAYKRLVYERIPQNFLYIGVKELRGDNNAVKAINFERPVELFNLGSAKKK